MFFEWFVMAMATFRLVRLFLYDELFSRWRAKFVTYEADEVYIHGSGWRGAVGYVLTCHWCAGIWVAGCVHILNTLLPLMFYVWLALSLAATSSLLHSWMEYFGWGVNK